MISPLVIRWLPLGAVLLHLIEEFVWPGGFAEWYRWYRPERAASVTTGFLVRINVLLVGMALIPGGDGIPALWRCILAGGCINRCGQRTLSFVGRAPGSPLFPRRSHWLHALFASLGFWFYLFLESGSGGYPTDTAGGPRRTGIQSLCGLESPAAREGARLRARN